MKKNKITLFVSAISALACVLMCNLSASAASEKIELKLNDTTTEEAKVVDVYYSGTWSDIAQFSIKFDVTENASTMTQNNFTTSFANPTGVYKASAKTYKIGGVSDPAVATTDGTVLLGTITIPVAAGTGAFDIEAIEIDISSGTQDNAYYYDEDDCENMEPAKLTIPAWTTGGGEEDEPTIVNATGALYDTYADAPVYASVAEAVTISDITDKKLTWQVKDTEGVVGATIPVTVRTDVNGDGSVIFGLMIIGDENAEELEKIDSAVLVIE